MPRPVLLTGEPAGALDPLFVDAKQSPVYNEADPYAVAQDMLRQRGIEAESEIERIKNDKWGKIFNAIGGFGAAISGNDPSQYSLQARLQPYQELRNQSQNAMSDINLQRVMAEQKMQMAQGNAGPKFGTINPRDWTKDSLAKYSQSGDFNDLVRYDAFTQDSVRWVPDGQGGVRPVVSDDQRMSAGEIDARIAQLVKQREEIGKGQGEVAVSDEVGDARADITRKQENAKHNTKAADDMYTQAQKLAESIPNYNDAIAEIDKGASTGKVQGMLPSFRSSTLKFEAAANRLGLNVIGQTTFGALSEGEMKMAMETAVPRGLEGPALRKWLVDKRNAEQKLISELVSAAEYLENGGSRSRLKDLYLQSDSKPEPETVDTLGPPSDAGKTVNWSDL